MTCKGCKILVNKKKYIFCKMLNKKYIKGIWVLNQGNRLSGVKGLIFCFKLYILKNKLK